MNVISVKVKDLKPYEKNPRKNDNAVKYVAESIKQFGFKVPIVIDKDNVIIAGHTRYKASKKLGLLEVPCIVADDLTNEQVKAFRLADNKVSEYSEWDYDILNLELSDLSMNMNDFGFDLDFSIEEEKEPEEDNYIVELKEPKAKLGDIYQLGNHRLMCGDSTNESDVDILMNEIKADISFTSPPYNVGSNIGYEHSESKYQNDSDNKSDNEYIDFLSKFTNNSIKHSKYTFVNIQSLSNNKIALIDYLYKFKNKYADTMIWDKGFGTPAIRKRVMNSAFEYIHIFSDKHNRMIGTKEFHGTIPNVLHIGSQKKNEYSDIHNATFSIEFVSFFIDNFSNQNEVILDLFGGTGTTLIAAEQLHRKCYMMELDPQYVDVIIDRWEKYTGQKAVKLK